MLFKTADLYDQWKDQCSTCQSLFKSYGGHKQFAGYIKTIKTFEDSSLIKAVVSEYQAKETILIIDGAGSMSSALLGDGLATLAIKNNIKGIIVNGCVRDSAILETMPIGILALGTHPKGSPKNNQGQIDIELSFWQAKWVPGEYAYIDEDGVIILKDCIG